MRFLDVCLNPAARDSRTHPVPYLLVVQGDFVDIHVSKLVVPLRRIQQSPTRIKDVMPMVIVLDEPFVVMTPEMAAVSVGDIGPVVASLAESHSLIRRAIDVLTGDF